MPLTYQAIQTINVTSSGTATIEFTSIPTIYTDLVIRISARTNRAGTDKDDEIRLRFNNDSGSNYYTSMIERSDSATYRSVVDSVTTYLGRSHANADDSTAGIWGNTEFYIPNYLSSQAKSVIIETVMENNATLSYASLAGGEWTGTAQVSSIQLTALGTFDQYSKATLYGILKA